jgi:hypothetical protein
MNYKSLIIYICGCIFSFSGAIHCFQIWVILICFGSVKCVPTGFFSLGLGGWKFGLRGWLASPCLHAMFSGGKSGEEKLRRFLGLCERVSLSLSGF